MPNVFTYESSRHEDVEKAKRAMLEFGTYGGNVGELLKNYMFYSQNRTYEEMTVGRNIYGRYKHRIQHNRDRRIVLAIHGGKCVMCGCSDNIELHHIDKLSSTGNRDITNIAPVCHKCHCKIHGKHEHNTKVSVGQLNRTSIMVEA